MKKLTLLAIVFSLFFIGCSDDEEVGTFGPNQTIVGFPETAITKSFLTDVVSSEITVPVGLISYANETLPGAVTVQWSVDASSTAVEGVEYDIISANSVTIPAGGTVNSIPFRVYPTTFDPDAPKTIVLNMTSTSALVGSQYKQVVITLQGVCPSNLVATYRLTYASGAQAFCTVTSTGDGTYYSNTTPGWLTGVYWFEFSDVCGALTATGWQFQAGNAMSGTGTVLANGNLAFNLTIAGVYSNRNYTLTRLP